MSFPRYPKYKPSGVEWLGDVPEHWDLKSIRRVIAGPLSNGIFKKKEEFGEGVLLVNVFDIYRPDFKVAFDTLDRVRCNSSETSAYEVLAGDLFFVRSSLKQEGIAVVAMAGSSSEPVVFECHLIRARPQFGVFDGRFGSYLLNSAVYRSTMVAKAKVTTMTTIDQEAILSTHLPIPAITEQTSIATFLDRETAKIDALVTEQRRLMELLKEKRQAVISHAVTKGLNPDAPMKPSGIEWLGEVPKHWNIERGRFLFHKQDLPPEADDGVVTAFRDGQVTLRENRRTEGFTFAVLEVGYQRVREGDLVIHGMDAFAGAIGVSESTGKCSPEYSVVSPARDGIDIHYYATALRLMAQRNFIYVICPSVRERAPRFRFEAFKDVYLPVPPYREQQEIMALINTTSSEALTLTAEAQRAIDLLQERRTALISAAVTGQIDVRGV